MGKVNLASILDKKPEEIEKPPLIPIGSYTWVIEKPHEFDTMGQDGQFETITFQVKASAPGEDVDPDDLQAYGDIAQARSRMRFMFNTEDEAAALRTENRLKRFLQEHVKCWEDGQTLSEGLANAVGQEFVGTIRHRPDKNDPETVWAEIDKTMAVD